MLGGVAMIFFFFLFGDWKRAGGVGVNGVGSRFFVPSLCTWREGLRPFPPYKPTLLQIDDGAGKSPAVRLRAGRSCDFQFPVALFSVR